MNTSIVPFTLPLLEVVVYGYGLCDIWPSLTSLFDHCLFSVLCCVFFNLSLVFWYAAYTTDGRVFPLGEKRAHPPTQKFDRGIFGQARP